MHTCCFQCWCKSCQPNPEPLCTCCTTTTPCRLQICIKQFTWHFNKPSQSTHAVLTQLPSLHQQCKNTVTLAQSHLSHPNKTKLLDSMQEIAGIYPYQLECKKSCHNVQSPPIAWASNLESSWKVPEDLHAPLANIKNDSVHVSSHDVHNLQISHLFQTDVVQI